MSDTLIHILNGDALVEHFPEEIKGERISFREALVEGPLHKYPLWDYYEERSEFIKFNYGQFDLPSYFDYSVPELEKIRFIENGRDINLWFEDDLFCQVNLWYLLSQLSDKNIFLVRPTTDIQYGFGGMGREDLVNAFLQRTAMEEEVKDHLACLWPAYVDNDYAQLRRISVGLPEDFVFIRPAIYAHIDRQPDGDSVGRPLRRLKEIISELDTENFGEVFREFSRTEAIYGFGDLQVKRLFDVAMKTVKGG